MNSNYMKKFLLPYLVYLSAINYNENSNDLNKATEHWKLKIILQPSFF